MSLFDRRCTECDHKDEVFEHIDKGMITECPKCKADKFVKQFIKPARVPPDGLYSFNAELDRNREAASAGHGNASYRM